MENIRAAIAVERQTLVAGISRSRARELLQIALAENRDALNALRQSLLGRLHPDARGMLRLAILRLQEAIQVPTADERNRLVREAIELQRAARADMIIPG